MYVAQRQVAHTCARARAHTHRGRERDSPVIDLGRVGGHRLELLQPAHQPAQQLIAQNLLTCAHAFCLSASLPLPLPRPLCLHPAALSLSLRLRLRLRLCLCLCLCLCVSVYIKRASSSTGYSLSRSASLSRSLCRCVCRRVCVDSTAAGVGGVPRGPAGSPQQSLEIVSVFRTNESPAVVMQRTTAN